MFSIAQKAISKPQLPVCPRFIIWFLNKATTTLFLLIIAGAPSVVTETIFLEQHPLSQCIAKNSSFNDFTCCCALLEPRKCSKMSKFWNTPRINIPSLAIPVKLLLSSKIDICCKLCLCWFELTPAENTSIRFVIALEVR